MMVRLYARAAGVFALLIVLCAFAVRPVQAQGSMTLIVGVVTDPTGKPVAGARVEAFSLETEVTRTATTNDKGQYRIVFNDGGAQYRLSVKAIGKSPMIVNVSLQSDDDRIIYDFRLGEQAQRIQDLVATAARRPNADQRENAVMAGEASRSISGDQALRLPIDAGDLAALAALAPGVILTVGTDSTAATFSVAGQSAASNTYVINGLTTESSTVPQDAVRNTRVITNTFDVSRGNFSGGMVSVTTKGGSNRVSGSVSSNFQNKDLAFGGNTGSTFGSGTTNERVGAGFGGPLKRDKVFLFGSFNFNRQVSPIASLDLADATTLSRLGASPDSVSKFISMVSAYGLTQRAGSISPNANNDQFSGVSRFDWNAGQTHVITLTGQLGLNNREPQRISSTQLPQVGGTSSGNSGSLGLQMLSRFNNGMVNTFRGGASINDSKSTPYLYVPVGRVTNFSVDSTGGVIPTTFGFGGNSGMPTSSNTKRIELTNDLSLISPMGTHRWVLGLYANASDFRQDNSNNQYGTFTYSSLEDFTNNVASSFTRTLQPSIRSGGSVNEAVYLSDAWRIRLTNAPTNPNGNDGGARGGGDAGGGGGGRGGFGGGGGRGGGRAGGGGPGGGGAGNLQLNYGLRVEHSSFTGAPARNDAVFSQFGLDTHKLPDEFYVTPRIGFSYSIPAPEQQGQAQRGFAPPLLTIRGGAGVFRGTMPATLAATAQAQSGLTGAQTQLYCTGSAVPVPDWTDYLDHPEDIPSECINDLSTPVITGKPSILAYDPNYGASKTKRLSFGLTRRITQRIQFNVDASYVRGVGQGASRDLNLNETPQFTVSNELNRPVYADKTQIDTSRGVVPLSASRKDINYGSVTQVFSGLQNETKQVTFNVSGSTTKQINLNLSYTMMFARDQGGSGGGFGGGNLTAGDPNLYEWATSSSQRRHNIQAQVQWPITPAFELTANVGVQSGSSYTPRVSGDINGDGSRGNDRAFVFNPATTTDTAVSNGMTRLLASTSGNGRACLESQLGQIAKRNTCVGPWQPRLDMQLNWRPAMFNRRLALNFSTQNLLGGLDQLINGDNIKGWGGNRTPDATLLTVRGFDATTNQYKYSVNERFGNTSSGTVAIRQPFQLRLGVVYSIGYDPRTLQIQNLARGIGGAPTGTAALDSAMLRFKRQNIATATLARKDSLVLSRDQIASLQALIDSSTIRLKTAIDSIRPEVEKVNNAGSAADIGTLMQKLGPLQASFFQLQTRMRDGVHAVLTDVQWALLPDSVKTGNLNLLGAPGGRGGMGGMGGMGGGGQGGGGRGGRGGGGGGE